MKLIPVLFALAICWAPTTSFAQSTSAFTLPKLAYGYNELEPSIDAQTMEIHHSKHHQAYVNNLNKAIAGTKAEGLSLEDLLITAGRRSDAVRNNAGGHYNHSLFWEILSPKAQKNPQGALLMAIEKQFTSVDSLKKLMNQAASTRFGSGWAWLIVTPDKKLQVCSSPNQDNPIMDISKERGIPVIGIDVWEHAYYLKYQNKRGDYLSAIWNVLDWSVVGKKYDEALNSPLLLRIEKDSWTALKDFHMVMAQTFHPAEEGNFKPLRERSGEMLAKALLLQNSTIPASFNGNDIKKAIADLVTGSKDLDKAVNKKAKDAVLMKKITALHDTFHIIQGLCEH
jgi:superoxide dismutase